MLKWFVVTSSGPGRGGATTSVGDAPTSGARCEVVTDDPLATIALSLPRVSGRRTARNVKSGGHAAVKAGMSSSRPRHIYAVSRINPIFKDDDEPCGAVANTSSSSPETSSPDCARRETGVATPESPRGKSAGSSGYESNPTDRTSSSEFSDDYLPPTGTSPPSLRSSLQSEAGSPPRTCTPAVRRLGTRRRAPLLDILHHRDMEHHVLALSTIPEGQIPKESISNNSNSILSIPAPIWPAASGGGNSVEEPRRWRQRGDLVVRNEPAAAQRLANNTTLSHLYRSVAVTTTPSPHEVQRSLPQPPPGPPDILLTEPCTSSSSRKYQRLRGIEAVKELWDKSGMKVNGSRRLLVESDELSDSRRCCDNNMPPAQTIHHPHSSSPPPPPPPLPIQQAEPQRCNNNNNNNNNNDTSSNSSGYSEISLITPPRRSVSPPFLDLTSPIPPVFLHHDLSVVSNSVRNAMIYGTLCRMKGAGHNLFTYERLWKISRSFDAAKLLDNKNSKSPTRNVTETPKSSSWESIPDISSSSSSSSHVKSFDKTARYYPPSQRPDFTLDIPKAERLLRKINAAKRQRCWCRIIISFLGLLFFLLSVMAVSMLYTRGRRLFGSL